MHPRPSIPEPPALDPAPSDLVVDAALEVTGLGAGVRVTVRRNGPRGRVLFAGTLAAGQTERFEGPRLHAAFRTPARVKVSVNGETLDVVPRRLVATADGWRRG